jgi:replicative DNA helicase
MKQALKNKIENIIGNEHSDDNEILFHLKNLLEEAELEKNSTKESKKISDLVSENLALLRSGQKWEYLIQTGFTDFDKSFGGFLEGELVIIGARPAMGKSLLLMNLALNISASVPLVYFTFDLSEFSLTNRIISAISKIEYSKIVNNAMSGNENDRLYAFEEKLKTHNLFINDSCYNSMPNFKSLCKLHMQENGVRVIIVDCLQLMSSFKFRSNREAEVSYVSRVDAPAKLTTLRRFILTTLRRSKLTT